ncbi:NAD(P)-dependent oxidoreductase [Roseospira marina]|uniref:NAD(P)-dependent oxidoreductase n=1 Tax=Roseospira marina TaxID=140057 RepID=A0A5M6IBI0_9PROT|nr:NAD(P)-dependent oxidoreductase [Roseospira marina]KAA5605317.1 NAD(P)-dependent oxidoreductase [Roseospira marina]MBB4314785.1 2-hydroxy-3-oxopropionate reductase [Roseospira marina]MBB5087774.1 2-hydroxy-3-oxopropionate reductase [Roseospira marina]
MADSVNTRVGVVGVGIMGTAIATRLLDCGLTVTLYDRSEEKVAAMVAKGAVAAASARAVAAASDVVILSLNNAAIVETAVFGPDGVAEAASPDKLLVDMSSIDPESTKVLAARLKDDFGMAWLDSPLSGGAPGAVSGTLAVMAGGTEEDFARARPVMDHLCANFTLMGPSGAGQTTKLVNQVLCAVGFQAIAEATQLALNGGVAVDRIPAALSGGRADSRLLQEFMAKMGAHDYSPTGRLDNMLKDLEAVQAFAAKTRTGMPLTALTTEIHRLFVAAGKGGDDNAALMKLFNGPAD